MRYLILLFLVFISQQAFTQQAVKDTVFTEYFRRSSGWTGGDGTLSIPVPCLNKTIWLFGDSFIDHFRAADTTLPCLFQVRNAIMVQDLENPSEFITILDTSSTGNIMNPVRVDKDHSTFMWPMHGYAKGDTVYSLWSQYQYKNEKLEHTGLWLATIDARDFTDVSNILSIKKLPQPTDSIYFGSAILVDSARNYIYVYGGKADWFLTRPVVARFPIDQPISGQWEYYNGDKWGLDYTQVEGIFGKTDHVSSITVFKEQGKYYLITQEIGFLTCGYGREIYAWQSENPYGPFVNKKLIYTIEDKYKGHYWVTYNAVAHPEFIKNNKLLISYNVNGFDTNPDTPCEPECKDVWHDRRNADGYRPKFIRVPLTMIDSTLQVPDVHYLPCDENTDLVNSEISSAFKIFPNPSKDGHFTILYTGVPASSPHLFIYDMMGRKVKEIQLTSKQTIFHLEGSGVYFMFAESREKRLISKLVVL